MSEDNAKLGPMDATIAAPEFHQVLLENADVRVLKTVLKPGQRTPCHVHQWPMTIYFERWSDIIRYDNNGIVTVDTRSMDSKPTQDVATYVPPVPFHTTENVGLNDLIVISIELKQVSWIAPIGQAFSVADTMS